MPAGLQDPQALTPQDRLGHEGVPLLAHEAFALDLVVAGVQPVAQHGDRVGLLAKPVGRIGDDRVDRVVRQGAEVGQVVAEEQGGVGHGG